MEHENAQTLQQKIYATPQLLLYGSVLALTAGGTGMVSEIGSVGSPGMPGRCYDGTMSGMNLARKHCV